MPMNTLRDLDLTRVSRAERTAPRSGLRTARLYATFAVLSMLSVLLGGCFDEDTTPVASPELLETGADLVIIDMENVVTVEGVNQGEIYADTAFFYRDSTFYLLRNPVLVLFTETGAQRARVVAERGTMHMNTDALTAQGNVVLTVQEGNRRVESQELHYDPNGDRIWSDSLTVLHEEGIVSEGLGFTSDLNFRSMTVGPGSIRNVGGAVRDSIG
jgi:LPS export ABC transporter protein LptC